MSTAMDTLRDTSFSVGGRTFQSRLMVGTGKYRELSTRVRAIEASGAEIVNVGDRRVVLDRTKQEGILHHLDASRYFLLAKTAGCYTGEEAVRHAALGPGAGFNGRVEARITR